MRYRLRLFGRFAVFREDTEVEVTGAKSRALLALLALHGDRHISRERLAGLVWSSSPDTLARQNLRQMLAKLKRIAPVFEATPETVRLAPDVDTDLAAFDAAARQGDAASLRTAVGLHEGPLLDDLAECGPELADIFAEERRRRSETVLRCIDSLLSGQDRAPGAAELTYLARAALKFDPFRESAHRSLMIGLARQGLRTEALRHWVELTKLLEVELDTEPEEATQRVAEAIRARQIGPDSATTTAKMAAAPGYDPRSIKLPLVAVLPLAVTAEMSDFRHLALGLSAEIADALGRFRSVAILSPGTVFRFAEDANRLTRLREDYGVKYLVAGELARRGNALVLTIRIVETATEVSLWTETASFERPDPDWIVKDLPARIVARLEDRMLHERSEEISAASADRLGAYDCWLRGHALAMQWTKSVEGEAEMWFRRAVETDPRCARAHSSLAMLLNSCELVAPGQCATAEQRRLALQHARLAIDCDPQDPRSHIGLGWVSFWNCDTVLAHRCFDRALALNPLSADVLIHCSLARSYAADHRGAASLSRQACALNPLHPDWYRYFIAVSQFLAGQHCAAIETGMSYRDSFLELGGFMTAALAHAGDMEAARAAASAFMRTITQTWYGPTPPAQADVLEWFMAVNRWLSDEDRLMLLDGLALAGLASEPESP